MLDGLYWVSDQWSIGARVLQDIGGADKGTVGFLGANYRLPLNSKDLIVDISGDVSFGNDEHMNTEFGISNQQAANSIYSNYTPGSGLKSYGISVNARYRINDRWYVTSELGYERYSSGATDSPLLQINGQDYQIEAEIGITYRF